MGIVTDMLAKNFLASKGFWGIVAMALPVAAKAIGFDWTDADTSEAVKIGGWVVEAGGFVMALIGRWNAKGPLTVGSTKVVAAHLPTAKS